MQDTCTNEQIPPTKRTGDNTLLSNHNAAGWKIVIRQVR